jgi:hypothetical protein
MSMAGKKEGRAMINVMDWVNESLPPNKYRGLDGKAYDFPFGEAQVLARSQHDSFFKLNQNYGWGVRWYALHRVADRYIFTVGHGLWHTCREVPADWVPELLFRYFTRNEVTDAGKALLE